MTTQELPLLLITPGDVAGVGPEIVARAWPELLLLCRPVVCGDAGWLRRGLDLAVSSARVVAVSHPREIAPSPQIVPCLQASSVDLTGVVVAQVSAAAGQAAYDFLCRAID